MLTVSSLACLLRNPPDRHTKSAKVETTGPSVAEFAKLNAKLAKSEKSLKTANELIELQKKISDILGVSLRENAASE